MCAAVGSPRPCWAKTSTLLLTPIESLLVIPVNSCVPQIKFWRAHALVCCWTLMTEGGLDLCLPQEGVLAA